MQSKRKRMQSKEKRTRRIIPAVFLLMALSFAVGVAAQRANPVHEYAEVHGVVYTITAHADIIEEELVVLPGGTFGYQIYVKNVTEVPRTFTVYGEVTTWEKAGGVWEEVKEVNIPRLPPKTIAPGENDVFQWDLGIAQPTPPWIGTITAIFYVYEYES